MLRIAIKSLLSHKLRMVLTTFAIVMGVAFVAGTYVFTDSIGKTFDNLFDDIYKGIDLTVRPNSETSIDDSFDEKYLEEVRNTKGVRLAEAGVGSDFVQFIDKNGEPIGGNGPPTLGFSWTNDDALNVLFIKEGNGRPPEAPGEVVMDVNTAEQNGFQVNDLVKIQSFKPVEEFKIVGLSSFGQADSLAGATIASFELSEAQRFFDLEGKYSEISLKVEQGFKIADVQSNLQNNLPDELEIVTGQQQNQEQKDEINEGLGFINIGLLAFAGIALFVGAYLIQNTFRIIVTQRLKELSLLRAIGATRRQIISSVVYEALIVGILASVIGILAGVGVASGIRAIANSAGLALPEGDLTVLPRTVIVALIIGVLVTVLSALLPAIKASRISPIEGLRDNESNSANKSLKLRGILSLVVVAIGTALLLFGLFKSGIKPSPIYYVGAGVGLMFLGVSAFAPLLSGLLGKLIGYPFMKLFGIPAKIASLNVGRTPRRTASTASALMIGVSLVTLVTIFAASINATVEQVVADSFPADVIALPQSSQDPEAIIPAQFGEDLKQLDELGSVSAVKYLQGEVNGSNQFIAVIEPETFNDVIKIDPSEGLKDIGNSNGVFIRDSEFDGQGFKLGQEIGIKLSDSEVIKSSVAGTYGGEFDAPYLISRNQYESQFGEIRGDTFVSALYKDRLNVDSAEKAVDEVAKNYPTVNVQDQAELVQQSKDQINQILGLIWSLLGFAVLIAVIGITNTLALSIVERKRELGLLRAIGMTKRQMRRMVRIESVIISLFGAILGVVMGTFFAWALLKALEDEGLTAFSIPYVQIIILFVLAAIAGILASIWPAYSASKVKILDAIKFE